MSTSFLRVYLVRGIRRGHVSSSTTAGAMAIRWQWSANVAYDKMVDSHSTRLVMLLDFVLLDCREMGFVGTRSNVSGSTMLERRVDQ